MSLAWPWSGRSLPVGVLGPWTGAQCGWVPLLPSQQSDQPKVWQVDIFHMAGWLANCSWLTDWLSNKMSTWPPPGSDFDIWSDVPTGRDVMWPSVILLQVRLTFGQMYPLVETSWGQVWYYFRSGLHLVRSLGQVNIWLDVPPIQRQLVAKCDTGGSHLSHTVVKPDSHLAWIFCQVSLYN